jgi:hypothetical protein
MSPVYGVAELKAVMDAMAAEVTAASVRVVKRSQAEVEKSAKKSFTGSHSAGEPTGSVPGEPPDVVTGSLRRSIISDKPRISGFAVTGHVYPSVVYARIQELGGGNNLPARPYMQPGYEASLERLKEIGVEEWGKATR